MYFSGECGRTVGDGPPRPSGVLLLLSGGSPGLSHFQEVFHTEKTRAENKITFFLTFANLFLIYRCQYFSIFAKVLTFIFAKFGGFSFIFARRALNK
jgi:hypothetical protein